MQSRAQKTTKHSMIAFGMPVDLPESRTVYHVGSEPKSGHRSMARTVQDLHITRLCAALAIKNMTIIGVERRGARYQKPASKYGPATHLDGSSVNNTSQTYALRNSVVEHESEVMPNVHEIL